MLRKNMLPKPKGHEPQCVRLPPPPPPPPIRVSPPPQPQGWRDDDSTDDDAGRPDWLDDLLQIDVIKFEREVQEHQERMHRHNRIL